MVGKMGRETENRKENNQLTILILEKIKSQKFMEDWTMVQTCVCERTFVISCRVFMISYHFKLSNILIHYSGVASYTSMF